MIKRSLFCFALCLAAAAGATELPPGPLPETNSSNIGYSSVSEALTSLTKRKDVAVSTVRDWTIIVDEANKTVWSFAPTSYPGYPAVVKRQVRARAGGGSEIQMSVLCEGKKAECDNLVREFNAMNSRI
jgi:hypothetical protein